MTLIMGNQKNGQDIDSLNLSKIHYGLSQNYETNMNGQDDESLVLNKGWWKKFP